MIKNLYEYNKFEDTCGSIAELYRTKDMSLAYGWIREAKPHKHQLMQEVYFITKGYGQLDIEGEKTKVRKGDSIEIPLDKFHYLKKKWHLTKNPFNKQLELIVANTPAYDRGDVILY